MLIIDLDFPSYRCFVGVSLYASMLVASMSACKTPDNSFPVQSGDGAGAACLPALRAGVLPGGHRLGACVRGLHWRVFQGRSCGRALLRVRPQGALMLRQGPRLHLPVRAFGPCPNAAHCHCD